MEHLDLQKVLGRGQFGVAWLARYKGSGSEVVVKKIILTGTSEKEVESIKKEVYLLENMKHPNITGYIESFENIDGSSGEQHLCIVMEYCDAGTLYDRIEDQKRATEGFSEQRILSWLAQLVLGISHIHSRGILHRDLKPQNIFLSGSDHIIKIGDFGLAKMLNADEYFTKTVVGTPYYLSPEACSWKPYNEKCDVWALGCILYELCSFRHAFKADNMPLLVRRILRDQPSPIEQVSQQLWDLLTQMLKKDPISRLSMSDVLNLPFLSSFIQDSARLESPELSAEFHKRSYSTGASSPSESTGSFYFNPRDSRPEAGTMQFWGRGQNIPRVEEISAECKEIAFGARFNAVVTAQGRLITWGEGKACGHGDVARTARPLPVIALAGVKISSIACGKDHMVAITDDGDVYSWGKGTNGKLGHGEVENPEDREIPWKVEALSGVKVVSAACGDEFTIFLTAEGKVYSCGKEEPYLGFEADDFVSTPTIIESLSDLVVKSVSCGPSYCFAITDSGDVYSWGCGENGVLGQEIEDDSLPEQVPSLCGIGIQQIACGEYHGLGLTSEGRVYGWGLSTYVHRTLSKKGSTKPIVKVVGPEEIRSLEHREVRQVACGAKHSLALTDEGFVYSWGDNSSGQLGHGNFDNNPKPTQIDLLLKKRVIFISSAHDRAGAIFA